MLYIIFYYNYMPYAISLMIIKIVADLLSIDYLIYQSIHFVTSPLFRIYI